MAELDWSNLSFQYRKTEAIIVSYYKDGQCSPLAATKDLDFHFSESTRSS